MRVALGLFNLTSVIVYFQTGCSPKLPYTWLRQVELCVRSLFSMVGLTYPALLRFHEKKKGSRVPIVGAPTCIWCSCWSSHAFFSYMGDKGRMCEHDIHYWPFPFATSFSFITYMFCQYLSFIFFYSKL